MLLYMAETSFCWLSFETGSSTGKHNTM